MLVRTNTINRRRVLKGMFNGALVTVSVPFLDMFLNDNGTAVAGTGEPLPARFGTWFWGLGVDPEPFTPKTVGILKEMPPQLKALENVKQHVNVLTNYNVPTDGRPNLCHFTGWVALRTGAAPSGRGNLPGRSLDMPISDAIGGASRFRLLNMAATGQPRDSYSFESSDAVNPTDISAVELYRKLFGAEFQDPNAPDFKPNPRLLVRKSVLSAVEDDRKDFMSGLGYADRARMDHYFTSIRDMEQSIDGQLQKPPPAPTCRIPKEPKEIPLGIDIEQVKARHRAMTDLLVMALACNQTRVFNMLYSGSGSMLSRKGIDKTHHVLTHEEPIDPELGYQRLCNTFVVEAMGELGYFVEKMANTPEGDGCLLDHMLVYAHSDCQVAKIHSLDRLPMLTAGRLNGKVKAGQHIDGKGDPGTRVGLTIQKLMGVPVSTWGTGSLQVTQEVSELLA
jgi:hypothetical protein